MPSMVDADNIMELHRLWDRWDQSDDDDERDDLRALWFKVMKDLTIAEPITVSIEVPIIGGINDTWFPRQLVAISSAIRAGRFSGRIGFPGTPEHTDSTGKITHITWATENEPDAVLLRMLVDIELDRG